MVLMPHSARRTGTVLRKSTYPHWLKKDYVIVAWNEKEKSITRKRFNRNAS